MGKIEGHSKYHVFRFTLNSEHKAEMHYKQYTEKPWEPSNAGIVLLSVSSITYIGCTISSSV